MATVSNTATSSSTANQTTYTFTAVAVGASGATQMLYVLPSSRSTANGNAVSSLTIDGVAASSIVQSTATEGSNITCVVAIYALARASLPDPTQTDVDIVVTFNAAMIRAAVDVYVGVGSAAAATATATDGLNSCLNNSTTMNLDLNVPASGIVLGAATTGNVAATWSWVGLTEQTDFVFENSVSSGALLSSGTLETARDISATTTLGCSTCAVAASFAAASGRPLVNAGLVDGGLLNAGLVT